MDRVLAALADGATVVTANNRLARSVVLAFNRRQAASGRVAWRSPPVLAWDAWIARLWADSAAAGGEAGARTLLGDFQARLLWAEVVAADPPAGDAGPAVAAIAAEAASAWRLCARWRVAPADLAASADSRDTRVFARWAAAYGARRAAIGASDAEHVTGLLAGDLAAGRITGPRSLHVAGFEEWSPLQREFLRVLAARGCEITEGGPPRAAGGSAVRVTVHDRAAELELAARWARGLVEGGARTVAIVVPDLAARHAEVRRAVLDVVAPAWRHLPTDELPANFSLAGPLADTGIARCALLLLGALTGRLDWRDAGLLLRSPYLAGAAAEGAQRARVDLALRDRVGLDIGIDEVIAAAGAVAPVAAGRLGALAARARELPRRQGAGAWAMSFRSALDAAGWPGDRALASDEFQALDAWGRLWDELHRCDGLAGPLTLRAALGLLGRLSAERVFQPAGHPDGIQVLGALEAVGQSFDAVWITGMTSDAWPPAVRPHPLVPLALQRRLGMPDSSPPLARERAERLLRWLEAGASQVVLSTPAFAGDEPLAPSPLVERLPCIEPADVPAWRGELAFDAIAASGGTAALDHDPPPPVVPGQVFRGGIAVLEREARCPARAFLEFRLGARELPVPATGIDPATRGTITHEVLAGFAGRVPEHAALLALSPADEAALLDALIDTALTRHLRPACRVLTRLAANERARLRAILGDFLARERAREGFLVRYAEEMPATGRLPEAVAALGIRLRPDRVDRLPDGRLLVIDYKTGTRPPALGETWGPRPRAPQLALYATALGAEGIAFVHLAAGGTAWSGIGREEWGIPGVRDPGAVTKGESGDWGALRAAWWTALDRLAGEFLGGCFDVDRWRRDDASGQWALATRVYDLPDDDADAEEIR